VGARGTTLAKTPEMDKPTAHPASDREPSIFLISLHMIMWTALLCGLIMVMVVYMLN
jgi:hypothetical protein